ncbi:MlaD family protein [Limisalsivibrio acetivorans]|uniref:MlaD family protein n=1 Tax=Limisalsivibrio acetivorans TaxID=1304888 RepID=UPI0003B787A8|nr:MlaD family protein [Limisalsivibrio acetivorans]
MKGGLEAKVGAFVILCFAVITFISLRAGDIPFLNNDKGYIITAHLNNAAGLTTDSAVMFHGVDVGKVKDITLEAGTPVAKLLIDDKYTIPENVMVVVRSKGFLGEKYAELAVIPGEEPRGAITAQTTLKRSESITDFDELGNKMGDIADDIKEITSALKEVLASEAAKTNITRTLSNVRNTTDTVNTLVQDNEMRVNRIVQNVEELTAALNTMTQANQQNVNRIIENIRVATEDIRRQTPMITSDIASASSDVKDIVGSNKEDIGETVRNLKTVTAKLETTVDNMNDITGKVKSGEGTVGQLIYDNKTADNVNNTLTSLQSSLNKLEQLQVYLSFEAERLIDEEASKGHMRVRIVPNEKRYYLLGVDSMPDGRTETTRTYYKEDHTGASTGGDIEYYAIEEETKPDSLKFTAQYAHRFTDDFYFRVGLMESDFGVGADYYPLKNRNLVLNLDAYDFPGKNDDYETHVTATARYRFHENFFVKGGYDDMLNEETRTFFIGGGVEFRDDDLKYLMGSVPVPMGN